MIQSKRCISSWKMIFLYAMGHLRQLTTNAIGKEIFTADGSTLKLYNQTNGLKGVCVYQEHNGDEKFSPVGYWVGDVYQSAKI